MNALDQRKDSARRLSLASPPQLGDPLETAAAVSSCGTPPDDDDDDDDGQHHICH